MRLDPIQEMIVVILGLAARVHWTGINFEQLGRDIFAGENAQAIMALQDFLLEPISEPNREIVHRLIFQLKTHGDIIPPKIAF